GGRPRGVAGGAARGGVAGGRGGTVPGATGGVVAVGAVGAAVIDDEEPGRVVVAEGGDRLGVGDGGVGGAAEWTGSFGYPTLLPLSPQAAIIRRNERGHADPARHRARRPQRRQPAVAAGLRRAAHARRPPPGTADA